MATYSLPRDAYELLVEALGEKEKAEVFARALERSIQAIDERANGAIVEKKEQIKGEVREELRQELVTRELFEERMKVIDERFNMVDERFKSLETEMVQRFNVVDERFKSLETEMVQRFNVVDEKFTSLNFKLNIFIAIALLALTLANPTFAALVGRLFP